VKNILILCTGYPYTCDTGFGYHVSRVLQEMELPENVECLEVGESACEIPHLIDGKDKMIVVDVFHTEDEPGTILRLRPGQVPLRLGTGSCMGKFHLFETLEEIRISGKCPETIFVGVVPKDIETQTPDPRLTPEIESKLSEVIDLIMKEIDCSSCPTSA
jgi:hydrogenase maturation protease